VEQRLQFGNLLDLDRGEEWASADRLLDELLDDLRQDDFRNFRVAEKLLGQDLVDWLFDEEWRREDRFKVKVKGGWGEHGVNWVQLRDNRAAWHDRGRADEALDDTAGDLLADVRWNVLLDQLFDDQEGLWLDVAQNLLDEAVRLWAGQQLLNQNRVDVGNAADDSNVAQKRFSREDWRNGREEWRFFTSQFAEERAASREGVADGLAEKPVVAGLKGRWGRFKVKDRRPGRWLDVVDVVPVPFRGVEHWRTSQQDVEESKWRHFY